MAEVVINPRFHKPESQPVVGERYQELTYDPKTGDSNLYEYNVVGGVRSAKFKVWSNGVWQFDPGVVVTEKEKKEVHDKAKKRIEEVAKKDPKNIVPGFVLNDAESQDIDRSGKVVPTQSSGGLIGNLFSSVGSVLDLNDFGNKDIKSLFNNLLKYPIDIIDNQQDILKITQYQYEAPYRDIFEGKDRGSGEVNEPLGILVNGIQRQSALKKFIQSVILPIPNNIADANGVNWGSGENLSSTNMVATGNMDKVLGAVGSSGVASMASNALKSLPLLSKALGTLGTKEAAQAMAMLFLGQTGALNTPATKAALMSLILKRANFDISPETILSRGYGVVANSNLELLFSGPTIRGFQFGYIMSPRSQKEAEMCRNIIRFFKQGMAAKKSNKLDGFGASSFLLGTPNVFKLEYKTKGDGSLNSLKDIKGLNKFKICALTNFNVSYADGQWAAYDEGQPIRYQITLSFKELEPIYESDYQEKPSNRLKPSRKDDDPKGTSYEDQPGVLPDEIGF